MSNLFDIKMVFTQIPDLLTYLPVTLELAVVAMIVSLILCISGNHLLDHYDHRRAGNQTD